MYKKFLSGLLALALVFGSAAALPEGVFEISSNITASAVASGDIVYEVHEALDGHEFAMVTAFTDESGTNCVIPDELTGEHGYVPVEVIAEGAFKEKTNLRTVTVPLSLRSIANSAFEGCTALTTIHDFKITDLKIIGDRAFKGCTSLETLSLPRNLETIGTSAFEGCASFKYLTIPSHVRTISPSAFKDCTSLLSLTISGNTYTIAYEAFSGCTSLYKVTLSEYIETIGARAFENCSRLPSITIPESVKTINVGTFNGCANLSSVTIHDKVEEINAYAFTNCENLDRIKIPSSVKTLGVDNTIQPQTTDNPVFDRGCIIICRPGSDVHNYVEFFGNKVQYYYGDYVYKVLTDETVEIIAYNGNDSKITIPPAMDDKKVSSIGIGAFRDCTSLTSVTIPDSVTTMKDGAFMGCSNLVSMTARKNVTKIGARAFGYVYDETLMPVVNPKFTVKCYKDTAVDTFAKDNGIDFEYLDATQHFASKPTCTREGYIEHWVYKGNLYLDKHLTKPTTEEKVVIKATGHSWGEPTWTWTGTTKATAKFVCANDKSHTKTVTAKITSKTTPATCEKDGKTVYTATATLDGKTYTKTKTVTIDKAGHNYGKPTWTWSGTTSATAKFVCANDKSHVETVKATISSKTTKATCTADGKTVYTATATFGGKTYTNTKTVTIDKLGHKFSAWKTVAYDFKKNTSTKQRTCSVCKTTETRTVDNAITRLKGSGRFATAAAISTAAYPETADTVVLANGRKFYDALAGVTLANAYGAPILLTEADSLPKETLAEIKRLKAKKVIILGGSGSVGVEVKQALTDNGLEFDIVKGSSRFATAVEIANKTKEKTKKDPTEIFFVSSDKFADALSVSSIAALKKAPIIYLPKTGAIDDVTAKYLKSLKGTVKNAYVIGGSGVIGADVMAAAAKALGLTVDKTIVRVKGSTKYDTCVAVNTKFASVLKGTAICVATGEDFPDALAGGVFSAVKTAPLFLASGSLSDTQKAYLKSKNADSIYVLGGSKSVPDSLVQNIAKASV